MKRLIPASLLFIALCSSAFAVSHKAWAKVKTEMTKDEIVELLGQPLIRNSNRGYEVWIYDSKAEVVFQGGPVIAWTVPTPNPLSEARPVAMDLPLNPAKALPYYTPKLRPKTAPGERPARPSTQFRYKQPA